MGDGKLARGRPALVSARRRKSWSQAHAAEAVGVSATTWARWESGEQEIRLTNRQRLAEVFDVSLEEVDRWADGADSEPLPWLGTGTNQSSLAATLERTSELWRWDVDPSRRRLLASLPFVPELLSEWLLSWQLDPPADSRAHEVNGPMVGLDDVRRVREAIDTFFTMDHLFGGGYVRPTIVDFLHHRVAPLLRGRYSDEVGSQLMTAAAAMTGMAGWEAYDLSMHGLAQAHYGQGLQLAKAADNPLMSAWILSVMAQQAIDLCRPSWAIRLARAACHAGEHAEAPSRVMAGLLLREARATALSVELADTRDRHLTLRVERLLVAVEDAYARARVEDDEPWWIHDLSEAEIAAESGCVWRMLGDNRRAADCAETALAGFSKEYPRSIQFNLIHRAQALLGMNELDQALDAARDALPLDATITSMRSIELVRAFDQALQPHSNEATVLEWRDVLHSEVPEVSSR